jgi:hypothetical protein
METRDWYTDISLEQVTGRMRPQCYFHDLLVSI